MMACLTLEEKTHRRLGTCTTIKRYLSKACEPQNNIVNKIIHENERIYVHEQS